MKNAIVGLLLIGCGTEEPTDTGPELLPDLQVPEVPENGLRVITPIVEGIQPGTDYEICTWTDAIVTAQTDVRSTHAFQVEPPGHHAILFYTLDKQPPGTQRECTDTDMASFRFLAGNGGNGVLNEAPGNLVYRIPPGAQIVVNHHYLNASDEVKRGQTAVAVKFADPGNYIPSGNTAFVETALEVPIGKSTHSFSCTLDRQLKLWYFAPHMHRWGTNIKVDVTKDGTRTRMFDTTWDPSFTIHPPENRREPSDPMVLNAGDKVDIECNWDNDTGRVLGFGFEMCLAFGQFVDDGNMGNWACDNGSWVDF
jgi:hypothetical protein